jgi:hypothetical protein
MAVDQTNVDHRSLDDFGQLLDARLREAQAALTALTAQPAQPPLGTFHDATVTAQRYEATKAVYVERLRRLIDALTAAQAATGTIAGSYRTLEVRNAASTAAIRDQLGTPAQELAERPSAPA